LPVGIKTVFASVAAGLFRILLMPIDTLKTIMQVEGKNGIPILLTKLKRGPQVLFYGAIATATATFVGHYPVILSKIIKNSFYFELNIKVSGFLHIIICNLIYPNKIQDQKDF
jgi:hypothetical protein